ncbi:MAG: alanine--glyoxylate aminotransferase family protein [Candidatus Heimdallarchaeota archaeon]|nr:alanine--glyoxylate aminotransferase family protein [Candidatus Heimdallarchaeota archaeon]MDH5645035.1 alanine--glyoxylate aminotransferase family protein [Candidatus Heimdallarchaeota archaeon]
MVNNNDPLIMIPGPTEVSEVVLKAFNKKTYTHTEREFIKGYSDVLQNLGMIFGSSHEYSPFVIAGAGTLSMEIALINLIDRSYNQKSLVFSTGYFGERFEHLLKAYQLDYKIVNSDIGDKFSKDQIKSEIEEYQPDIAFIQHVDTSSGVANNIEEFGIICHDNNVFSVVDGVCSVGGQPTNQEKWKLDICFTGAQKALSVPPGLSIAMFSPKARDFTEKRKSPIPSYYANVSNWWPIMDAYRSGTVKYFSTPATNLIMTLKRSIDEIIAEGIDARFDRHKKLAELFRSEMKELGFEFLTKDTAYADTLTTPKYPESVDPTDFRGKILQNGVQVAGGILSGHANEYFRVGHMGTVSENDIKRTLHAIKSSL